MVLSTYYHQFSRQPWKTFPLNEETKSQTVYRFTKSHKTRKEYKKPNQDLA